MKHLAYSLAIAVLMTSAALTIASCGRSTDANVAQTSAIKAQSILTADDLRSFYGTGFRIGNSSENGGAPSGDMSHVSTLSYISEGDQTPQLIVTLLVRQSADATKAKHAAQDARAHLAAAGLKPAEDAAGIGDLAYWSGRQLNFVKGPVWIILSASGKDRSTDQAASRTAATALAQMITARLK